MFRDSKYSYIHASRSYLCQPVTQCGVQEDRAAHHAQQQQQKRQHFGIGILLVRCMQKAVDMVSQRNDQT